MSERAAASTPQSRSLTPRGGSQGKRRGGHRGRAEPEGGEGDADARAALHPPEAGLRRGGQSQVKVWDAPHPQCGEAVSLEQDAPARERRVLQAHLLRTEQRVVHGGVAVDRLRQPLSVLLAPPLQPDGPRVAVEGGLGGGDLQRDDREPARGGRWRELCVATGEAVRGLRGREEGARGRGAAVPTLRAVAGGRAHYVPPHRRLYRPAAPVMACSWREA